MFPKRQVISRLHMHINSQRLNQTWTKWLEMVPNVKLFSYYSKYILRGKKVIYNFSVQDTQMREGAPTLRASESHIPLPPPTLWLGSPRKVHFPLRKCLHL